MAKKKTKDSNTEISFEQSFEELQRIVAKLEDGQLPLSESLSSYELGIKRLQECYRALNDAESRIRKLTKLDANGNIDASTFEMDSGDEQDESSPRRKARSKPRNELDDGLF